MERYEAILTSTTPLIMHKDNLPFSEKVTEWRMDPANKELSVKADDRSPAWTWVGYSYHNGNVFCLDSDCIMSMLRDAGAKVKTGNRSETYKKQTSQVVLEDAYMPMIIHGKEVPIEPFEELIGNHKFHIHEKLAEDNGFKLFVKRVKIGANRHVRVRPMFDNWRAIINFMVDEEMSGLTERVLKTILDIAGIQIGLCDWRPSSPTKGGTFGRFAVELKKL